MQRTIECINCLNLNYISLEVDQAIYNKVLQVLFTYQKKENRKFDKLIVSMGGFYVILCLLRTIYSRLKDSGITELLVEAGVGTEVTIQSVIRGGDVKPGIRYYKILYEAFTRSKLNFLENSTCEKSDEFKNKICNLCNNINHNTSQIVLENHFDETSIPTFPGDMSNWIQSLINMIDILLNMIHFQRIGNWEGYLQAIRKFLPWCFVLNRHNYAVNLRYHYVDMCNLNKKILVRTSI